MKYRSRLSVLFITLIVGIFLIPLSEGSIYPAKAIVLAMTALFIVLVFATINYSISSNSLIIRTFWYKMATIDIATIKSIKRSYNPLSSPAASLKRLEVKFYHKGKLETALISPVDEAHFLEQLKEINPNIEIRVVERRGILRFWDWDI